MTEPFQYPELPHVRRHGPQGYAEVASFRPWLRDEFTFRCVYCLQREAWGPVRATYDLDHFLPVLKHPGAALEYDNLLYACTSCNSAKQDAEIPDPLECLLRPHVCVRSDGVLEPLTPTATALVLKLGLSLPRLEAYRAMWIEVIRLARQHKPELYRQLMGYPEDLPDLSDLRPPGGNTRRTGIALSHRARRERGELPETY